MFSALPTATCYSEEPFTFSGSHSLEIDTPIRDLTLRSFALGIDVQTELLIIVSELKKYAMSSLPISATEIQQLEKKIRQLQVIDTLFGTLSDIPSKEIEAFDEAIERRDFFG